MRTTAFRMSSVLTSESNPRDARLTARRSNGSALHTLDHQFSKSRAQKVRAQTPMLTGGPAPGQGGLIVEDTGPLPPPRPPASLAEPQPPWHIPSSWSRSPPVLLQLLDDQLGNVVEHHAGRARAAGPAAPPRGGGCGDGDDGSPGRVSHASPPSQGNRVMLRDSVN